MNETDGQATVAAPKSWHMIRAMGGIGLLCGLLIVLTYEATLPTITRKKAEYLEKAIYKVLPGAQSSRAYRLKDDGSFEPFSGDVAKEQVVYAGFDVQNQLVGIAVEASGQGFQDAIRILYGYSPEKQVVVGIAVLESKETPGLGDKIEKDPGFLKNFEALDVSLTADGAQIAHPIVPVKHGTKANPWEIDAITGATISSKAIANILQQSTGVWIPLIAGNTERFRKSGE
ncbi:MAG: FMN-binding protein [bacterium]